MILKRLSSKVKSSTRSQCVDPLVCFCPVLQTLRMLLVQPVDSVVRTACEDLLEVSFVS